MFQEKRMTKVEHKKKLTYNQHESRKDNDIKITLIKKSNMQFLSNHKDFNVVCLCEKFVSL